MMYIVLSFAFLALHSLKEWVDYRAFKKRMTTNRKRKFSP